MKTFQIKRGLKANLPVLSSGEFAFTTDYNSLFVGNGSVNIPIASISTADITYYVNTSTGNDSNNGTTSGTPFKTIQHAIDILPEIIDHNITLNVAAGTYNESVNISFGGSGTLTINGGTNLSNAANYVINNIIINYCSCRINITGVTGNSTTTSPFKVNGSQFVKINYCNVNATSASWAGYEIALNSCAYIVNSGVSNRLYGLYSTYGSNILSENNSGTGNTYALISIYGGTISKYSSTQPTGTNSETVQSGGVIR